MTCLLEDLRGDVVRGADGGVGQLPPLVLPALRLPLGVHRGVEVGRLHLKKTQKFVESDMLIFYMEVEVVVEVSQKEFTCARGS